jgi:hypothetical protein
VNEPRVIASLDGWLEEAGEVDLIGGWAQVALADDFTAQVATADYQVFLTSYDAVVVFVQNRTAQGFEIHASSVMGKRQSSPTRCAYRVLGRRTNLALAGHRTDK